MLALAKGRSLWNCAGPVAPPLARIRGADNRPASDAKPSSTSSNRSRRVKPVFLPQAIDYDCHVSYPRLSSFSEEPQLKTAAEYLDALRVKLNVTSDYALHKALDVTKSSISGYRHGKTHFDADIASKVAQILGIPEEEVFLDAQIWRAKSEAERAVWTRVAQRLAACVVVAVAVGTPPLPAEAATSITHLASVDNSPLFIMSTWRRRLFERTYALLCSLAASLFLDPRQIRHHA